MVNKRGWLRIVEASVAIVLILGAMMILYSDKRIQTEQPDLSRMITPVLEELSRNSALREKIISGESDALEQLQNFASERITNPNLGYAVKICTDTAAACGLETQPEDAKGNIYASERILSSTYKEFKPVKVKIFVWRKS